MSYNRNRQHSGAATLIMLLAMLAAAASGALASQDASLPLDRTAQNRAAPPGRHWAPAQVKELIAAIEDAEDLGLDPSDYGIAALRSELDQSVAIWGRADTHQLDVLAGTSALALANAFRARAGTPNATAADLDAAVASERLGSWLTLQGLEGQGRL